jgi:hypothetical protein
MREIVAAENGETYKMPFLPNTALENPKRFYLYSLIDPRTQEVRYIGLTSNPQTRFLAHRSYANNSYYRNSPRGLWFRELKVFGIEPDFKILATFLDYKIGSLEERLEIQRYTNKEPKLLNFVELKRIKL